MRTEQVENSDLLSVGGERSGGEVGAARRSASRGKLLSATLLGAAPTGAPTRRPNRRSHSALSPSFLLVSPLIIS